MRSGKALSCTIIVSLSLVLTLIWSCPAGASITAIGDIEPAYDGSDPWMLWTIMRVGTTADANLVVSGGSQIRSPNYMVPMSIGLAWESGVTASLTVTGPGSLVNASTTTGIAGNASLLVADGATLSGLDAVLGQNAGSTGLATVTGTGSLWENQRNLEIGRGGDGTVTVANGGMLTSAGAYLGFNAGSVGRVTVTGPNSVWESLPAVDGGDINIGWFGDGSVTVADGARVTTIETGTELALWQPGATGTLTVTGPNSLWETELVTIGGRGNATVNIFDGGRLVSETVYSAGNDGSTATISVSGPGSLLEADEYLAVAGEGQADMVISNSGRVHSGWSEVAQWEPSVGTVTVTGPNSVWEAGDSLTLGVHGDASMVVADGGRVISRVTHVAAEAESDSTVLVTGSGSRWENSDTLFLGDRGIGAMTVADGGSLITSHVVVGGQAGSVGNLLVTGPGTTLQAAPAPGIPGAPSDGNTPETYLLTTIGRDGTGNVTIADGARVTADGGSLFLGYYADGVGSLTVTGPNSVWEDAGLIRVGNYGTGTLLISNGGTITSTSNANIGGTHWPFTPVPTSHGTVTVTDPGSLWRIGGGLYVGGTGQGELLVSAGGRVESELGQVDGTAEVAGAGSLWQNERDLVVGQDSEALMYIEMGGRVTDANAYVGRMEGANGLVNIRGAGSTWDSSAELQVGAAGQGSVAVEEGGRLTSRTGVLGAESSGQGVVEITGTDSVWEILPDSDSGPGGGLYVGQNGYGLLWIDNGGRVTSSGAYIGNSPSGGDVMMAGAGSAWDNGGELQVGVAGWGTMSVEDGAYVTSRTGVLGVESTGSGYVRVDSPGSLWEISPDPNTGLGGDLAVGQAGSGHLQIGSISESGVGGGTVTAKKAVVGALPGSEGLITTIGEDSRLEIEEGFVIGAEGSANMGVAKGGVVETATATMAQGAGSSAHVSIADANSFWKCANRLEIGGAGAAAVMIDDGGRMLSPDTTVAAAPGGTGAVTVTGTGSSLMSFNLDVGEYGQASAIVTDGGVVSTSHTIFGVRPGAVGTGLVSGPGSLWGSLSVFDVGHQGDGLLTVAGGGRVTSVNGRIGAFPGGVGVVVLTGPDSLWTNTSGVYVGGSELEPGGTGTLVLEEGARVESGWIRVWPGGTIAGNGTLRAGEVSNHGTIQPGASIGTLTVDGDLTLEPDGVIEVEIDNNNHSDKILVTGEFTMATGVVKPIPTQTILGTHEYDIIDANSVQWPQIAVVFGYDAAFLSSYISQSAGPNSVILHVMQIPFDDPRFGRTTNQRALGAALEQIAEQDPNNEITTALQQLQTDEQAQQAYDQLSGQTIPALAPVSVADTTKYMGTISHRLRDSAGGLANRAALPLSPAGTGPDGMAGSDRLGVDAGRYGFAAGNGTPYLTDEPWAIWGSGYGLFGDRDSESGVPGYNYQIYGGSFGLDYQFTERLLLGVAGGYSDGDINYSSSRDRADITSTHGGLYGRYETPWWYVDAIGTYADLDYETRRFVDLLGEQLEGDPSGSLVGGYFEIGAYRWLSERCLIQPLAAFQFALLRLDSFTESGGTAALHFDSESFDSYQGSLGVKVTQELFRRDDGCRASAELRGRWVHEFGDTQASLDAEFLGSPGVVFRVSDAEVARDSAILGAGLDAWFGQSFRAFADYTAELNSDNTVQLVSAGLEYRW